jgi:hypothetical protein
MESKKSSSTEWLLLGAVLVLLLFVFAYINRIPSMRFSAEIQGLASVIFGAGGALCLVIGIVKFVMEKLKK